MVQVIKNLCDRHHRTAPEDQVEAVHVAVALKLARKEGEADLCVDCFTELAALLEPWFEIGRRPGRPQAPVVTGPPKAARKADTATAEQAPAGPHRKQALEPDPDGRFHCRWPDGTCDDVRDNAQGRSMHERRRHDFHFNGLDEDTRNKILTQLYERLFAAA